MRNNKSIRQFKKEVTKNYIKYDNETLVNMLNEGKRDEVINSLLPMVIDVVNNFNTLNQFDELLAVANEGLLNSFNKYDYSKNDNIFYFCKTYVRWWILNYLRKEKNLIRLPHTNKKIISKRTLKSRPTAFNTDNITNFDYQDEDYVEINISRRDIEELLMLIPNLKYSSIQLFLDYYLTPNTSCKKLAEKLDYTPQNVSLIVQGIIKKIKSNPQLMDKFRDILFG